MPNVVELAGSKLVRLVKSKDFRRRLAAAVRIAMRTGHETGFCYFADYDNEPSARAHWSSVVEGGGDHIELRTSLLDSDLPEAPWIEELAPLIHVHLHPYTPEHDLDLSERDLANVLVRHPDRDVRQVYGIGSVREGGAGSLLLLRPTFRTIDHQGGIFEQVCANYERCQYLWPSQEFATELQVPGFLMAAVIGYSIPPTRGDAVLSNLGALQRFAT